MMPPKVLCNGTFCDMAVMILTDQQNEDYFYYECPKCGRKIKVQRLN